MSYREFLDNIDTYVGKVVEFTSRFKADGKTFKTERMFGIIKTLESLTKML